MEVDNTNSPEMMRLQHQYNELGKEIHTGRRNGLILLGISFAAMAALGIAFGCTYNTSHFKAFLNWTPLGSSAAILPALLAIGVRIDVKKARAEQKTLNNQAVELESNERIQEAVKQPVVVRLDTVTNGFVEAPSQYQDVIDKFPKMTDGKGFLGQTVPCSDNLYFPREGSLEKFASTANEAGVDKEVVALGYAVKEAGGGREDLAKVLTIATSEAWAGPVTRFTKDLAEDGLYMNPGKAVTIVHKEGESLIAERRALQDVYDGNDQKIGVLRIDLVIDATNNTVTTKGEFSYGLEAPPKLI